MKKAEIDPTIVPLHWDAPEELMLFEPALRALVITNALLNYLRLSRLDASRVLKDPRPPRVIPRSVIPAFFLTDLVRVEMGDRAEAAFILTERLVWLALAILYRVDEPPFRMTEMARRALVFFSPPGDSIVRSARTLVERARITSVFRGREWFFLNGDGEVAHASTVGPTAAHLMRRQTCLQPWLADDELTVNLSAAVDPAKFERALLHLRALRQTGVEDSYELLYTAALLVARTPAEVLGHTGRLMALETFCQQEKARSLLRDRATGNPLSKEALALAARFPIRIFTPDGGDSMIVTFSEEEFVRALSDLLH